MTHILPRVAGILATTVHGVIGYQDELPWSHKPDLKRFFKITKGHALLMGARTFIGTLRHNFKPGQTVFPNRELFILGRPKKSSSGECWAFRDEILEVVNECGCKIDESMLHCIVPSDSPLDDLKQILSKIDEESKLFIAGGATCYGRYLEFASTVYATIIDPADTDGGLTTPNNDSDLVYLLDSTKNLLFSINSIREWTITHEGSEIDGSLIAEYLVFNR